MTNPVLGLRIQVLYSIIVAMYKIVLLYSLFLGFYSMNFKEILKNIMLFAVVRIAVSISPRVGQKDKMSPFLFYLLVADRAFALYISYQEGG